MHPNTRRTSAAIATKDAEPTASQEAMPPPGPLAPKPLQASSDEVKTLKNARIITKVSEVHSVCALADALLRFASQQSAGQQTLLPAAHDKKVFKALGTILSTLANQDGADNIEIALEDAKEAAKEGTKEGMREVVREEVKEIIQGEVMEMLKEELRKMGENQDRAHSSWKECQQEMQEAMKAKRSSDYPPLGSPPVSYSAVTAAGVTAAAHPNLVARKATQERQILIKLSEGNEIMGREVEAQEVLQAVQRRISAMEDSEGIRIRMVTRNMRRNDMVLEMATDAGAAWIRSGDRMRELAEQLGGSVKERTYTVIVKFVPTIFDHEKELDEVTENNGMQKGDIVSMRPIKPVERRKEGQLTAHYIAAFKSAELANRAISNGLVIHNRDRKVEKLKTEPMRCLKCQEYGHMAKDCEAKEDVCATCAATGHRSAVCTVADARGSKCVSCKVYGHASWDRSCPAFLRRCDEMDQKQIENALPYFPSSEPWTWLPNSSNGRPQPQYTPGPPPPIYYRQGSQRERQQDNGWETVRRRNEGGARNGGETGERPWLPGPGQQPPGGTQSNNEGQSAYI